MKQLLSFRFYNCDNFTKNLTIFTVILWNIPGGALTRGALISLNRSNTVYQICYIYRVALWIFFWYHIFDLWYFKMLLTYMKLWIDDLIIFITNLIQIGYQTAIFFHNSWTVVATYIIFHTIRPDMENIFDMKYLTFYYKFKHNIFLR